MRYQSIRDTDKEIKVMSLRKRGLSFSKIGEALHITRQRAHQIFKRMMTELKAREQKRVTSSPIVRTQGRRHIAESYTDNGHIRTIGMPKDVISLIDRLTDGEDGIYKPVKKNYK